jgi:hypothetical protein
LCKPITNFIAKRHLPKFVFRQYQAGVLDGNVWKQEIEVISLLLGTARTRSWWNTIGKGAFEQDLPSVVDSFIQGNPDHPYWDKLVAWQSTHMNNK